jgi:DNA invertase Pin-like site-specific DNA recombinase
MRGGSSRSPSRPATPQRLRCAIYTRVSNDAGLEQEFNSLDNQREAGEAYIRSQAHEGWTLLPGHYDDGGFSGGTLERPALKALIADIEAKRIDIIVVYKVDRLTRSLADFARLVELFDAAGVSFVSVTQAFNTTNSMGRLTLNVLLSFAQFEREVTGERIRDKIAASKKKGIWMGGRVPYGYRVEARKLIVVPEEADEVRAMFRRYLEIRSVPELAVELKRSGFRTRVRQLSSGRTIGGIPLTHGPLSSILKNRLYLGELIHRGQTWPGEHEAIIDRDLFEAVQSALAANASAYRTSRQGAAVLLLGRIWDDRGNRMMPSQTNKGSLRYRYYVSCAKAQNRPEAEGSVPRVSAPEVERIVLAGLRNAWDERNGGSSHPNDHRLHDTDPDLPPSSDDEIVAALLDHVVVSAKHVTLRLRPQDPDGPSDEIVLPCHWQRQARRRSILVPTHGSVRHVDPIRSEARARLLAGIVRARTWVDRFLSGAAVSTKDIASAEGLSERAVRMTLPLAFLSPAIIQAAINGTLPHYAGMTLLATLPDDWELQQRRLEEGN